MNTRGGMPAAAILIAATTTKTKVTNGMGAGVKTAECASKVALHLMLLFLSRGIGGVS